MQMKKLQSNERVTKSLQSLYKVSLGIEYSILITARIVFLTKLLRKVSLNIDIKHSRKSHCLKNHGRLKPK